MTMTAGLDLASIPGRTGLGGTPHQPPPKRAPPLH